MPDCIALLLQRYMQSDTGTQMPKEVPPVAFRQAMSVAFHLMSL